MAGALTLPVWHRGSCQSLKTKLLAGQRGGQGNLVCGLTWLSGCDRLIVAMGDVHHRPANHPCFGFTMHVRRESEVADVSVVLRKFKLLHEEGWRFNYLSFGAHQASGITIDKNATLEQAGPLHPRLKMEHVN